MRHSVLSTTIDHHLRPSHPVLRSAVPACVSVYERKREASVTLSLQQEQFFFLFKINLDFGFTNKDRSEK